MFEQFCTFGIDHGTASVETGKSRILKKRSIIPAMQIITAVKLVFKLCTGKNHGVRSAGPIILAFFRKLFKQLFCIRR